MISLGRGIRWYNDYQSEVEFSKKYGFDFMQVWFKDGVIQINSLPEPREKFIKKIGYPIILHAVFTLEGFDRYGERLLDIVEYLEHSEVIVHPVCRKADMHINLTEVLIEKVYHITEKAKEKGIIIYLENNSVIDGMHYTKEDVQALYLKCTHTEQLLDVAHMDNYEQMEQIVEVKFPKCLHVAGKHFDIKHEHLPLSQGDIDYKLVFQKYLRDYDGRIILEVDGTDEEIIESRDIILEALSQTNMGIVINQCDINSSTARTLVDELSNELQTITGNSGRACFQDTDINNPRLLFVVALEGEVAVGCGAFRELSDDTAEIKRMYARKKSSGVGGKILAYLEEQAKEFGYSRIVLETRKCNEKAVSFYQHHGYKVIKNYGKYVERPEAVCFEKILK